MDASVSHEPPEDLLLPVTTPPADVDAAPGNWRNWSAGERESFFAAIARHRRAAWRVTLASRAANTLTALIVAVLMAPLFYAALALVLDLINIVVPTPNIVESIMAAIGPAMDAPEKVALSRWLTLGAVAAVPGMLWMAGVTSVLARTLRLAGMFGQGELAARAPNAAVLAEQRLANVVSEMAIAAGIPEPRVLIADQPTCNAAAFGGDERHASVMVTSALLAQLNREQMQGVAAHLIASIADGDMTIGLRVATTQCVFGLVTRFSAAFTSPVAVRHLLINLCVALVRPNGATARALMAELTNPLENAAEVKKPGQHAARGARRNESDWRMLFWIPFAGPVLITGFVCAIVSMILLDPLVSFAWRQRKYMADAVAVRLTRDPDTLATALNQMSRSGGGAVFGAWAAHLSVVRPSLRGDAGAMHTSVVPSFPSISRRLQALGRMGSHVSAPPRRIPIPFLLAIAPLAALVVALEAFALCMLVVLSIGLSMLFLGIPFGIVHMLLRWLGH